MKRIKKRKLCPFLSIGRNATECNPDCALYVTGEPESECSIWVMGFLLSKIEDRLISLR